MASAAAGSSSKPPDVKRETYNTSFAIWAWTIHFQKRALDGIVNKYSIDFTADVQSTKKVKIDVYSLGKISVSRFESGRKAIEGLLEEAKRVGPEMKSVSQYSKSTLASVPTIPGQCFLRETPDGQVFIIGQHSKTIDDVLRRLKITEANKKKHENVSEKPNTTLHVKETMPKTKKHSTLKIHPPVEVKKYIWLYVIRFKSDGLHEATSPYKVSETEDTDIVKLTLSRGRPISSSSYDRLMKFISEITRQVVQEDITTCIPLGLTEGDVAKIASSNGNVLMHMDTSPRVIHLVGLPNEISNIKDEFRKSTSSKERKAATRDPKPTDDFGRKLEVSGEETKNGYPTDDGYPLEKSTPDRARSHTDAVLVRKNYKLSDKTIHIYRTDITELQVDVLVNAANSSLSHMGGVAKAISTAAGPGLQTECTDKVQQSGKLRVSETYVSKGYNLPCKYVIHTVGPYWKSYSDKFKCEKDLFNTFDNCLEEAHNLNCRTIAIPAVSSGIYQVPLVIVAKQLFMAVTEHIGHKKRTSLERLYLVDFNTKFLKLLQDQFNDLQESNDLQEKDPHDHLQQHEKDDGKPIEEEICTVCMGNVENAKTLACGHAFCAECIDNWSRQKPTCPMCGAIFGDITGNQPVGGKMRHSKLEQSLPGYETDSDGTIEITYSFRDDIQTEEHPNPGRSYRGTQRIAYLPSNQEGEDILYLLERAFSNRVTFTVGRSTTSSRDDQITWNDIHHKTNMTGGAERFGYPDSGYLRRVREELAAKGIISQE